MGTHLIDVPRHIKKTVKHHLTNLQQKYANKLNMNQRLATMHTSHETHDSANIALACLMLHSISQAMQILKVFKCTTLGDIKRSVLRLTLTCCWLSHPSTLRSN